MKKKLSRKKINELEKEMKDLSFWEKANHTVEYKGPTSIRFQPDLLKKLNTIAHIKKKSINKLVNEYVKIFVDEEYELLESLR